MKPNEFSDTRGTLAVVMQEDELRAELPELTSFKLLVSIDTSYGVPRGLHVNVTGEQGKLVWAQRGMHWSVAVDVRKGSPTAGLSQGALLCDRARTQLWVPPGFAHGTVCLSPVGTLQYLSTTVFKAEEERSLALDCLPLLAWPMGTDMRLASPRDLAVRSLEELWASYA